MKQFTKQDFVINFKTSEIFSHPRDDTLTLIDEADYYLIDCERFRVEDKPFIGMTATTFKEGEITVEKNFIENALQIQIYDSKIPKIIDTDILPIKTSCDEFFKEGRCNWPKLVYC